MSTKEEKKIGIFDNCNQMNFCLVRYLRDRGLDAELIVVNGIKDIFFPEHDTYDTKFLEYSHFVNWGTAPNGLLIADKDEVLNIFKQYRFILGASNLPAYASKFGICLDIFLPHGGDFTQYPFISKKINWKKLPAMLYYVYHQRRGIRKSRAISMGPTSDEFEKVLKSLRPTGKRLIKGIPMIYAPEYNENRVLQNIKDSQFGNRFKQIKEQSELVIFHQSRHIWADHDNGLNHNFNVKNNDYLIRAFSNLIRERDINARLILFEYGDDVAKSKKLIDELQIRDKVEWFPTMSRKEVMIGLYFCDIATGEFGASWLTGGAILEALVMNKPLIHRVDFNDYKGAYDEFYPVLSACSSEEILAQLINYVDNKDYWNAVFMKGREWYENYIAQPAVDEIISFLND